MANGRQLKQRGSVDEVGTLERKIAAAAAEVGRRTGAPRTESERYRRKSAEQEEGGASPTDVSSRRLESTEVADLLVLAAAIGAVGLDSPAPSETLRPFQRDPIPMPDAAVHQRCTSVDSMGSCRWADEN